MAGNTPIWLRIVGVLGIAWNAVGVWSYLMHVGAVPSPPDMPQATMPMAVTAAYAVGVFGAVLGCVGLALGRRWAAPVLLVSLLGLIIDWGWVFVSTTQYSLPIGVSVLVIALALLLLAKRGSANGWLR